LIVNDVIAALAVTDGNENVRRRHSRDQARVPNFGADAVHDSRAGVAALFAGSMLKTTAVRDVKATVAVAAVTAGKIAAK
jgi:hypothetical protein